MFNETSLLLRVVIFAAVPLPVYSLFRMTSIQTHTNTHQFDECAAVPLVARAHSKRESKFVKLPHIASMGSERAQVYHISA